MAWVEKNLKDHLVSTPLPWAGSPTSRPKSQLVSPHVSLSILEIKLLKAHGECGRAQADCRGTAFNLKSIIKLLWYTSAVDGNIDHAEGKLNNTING